MSKKICDIFCHYLISNIYYYFNNLIIKMNAKKFIPKLYLITVAPLLNAAGAPKNIEHNKSTQNKKNIYLNQITLENIIIAKHYWQLTNIRAPKAP